MDQNRGMIAGGVLASIGVIVLIIASLGAMEFYPPANPSELTTLQWSWIGQGMGIIMILIGIVFLAYAFSSQDKPEPSSTKKFCKYCGQPVENDFMICPSCGIPIRKKCPDCDKELSNDSKFCPYCGHRFET